MVGTYVLGSQNIGLVLMFYGLKKKAKNFYITPLSKDFVVENVLNGGNVFC